MKKNYLTAISTEKNKLFFWLIIVASILVRVIWGFFFSKEYWGDAYHNQWVVEEYKSFGAYFDYKDRHLVWLPAYRWLLILFERFRDVNILPMLLQTSYVLVVAKWCLNKSSKVQACSVIIVLFWPLTVVFSGFSMPENLSLLLVTGILILLLQNKFSKKAFVLILILSAISSITRHEATAFLGMLSVLLMCYGKKRESASILIGLTIGLAIFSIWNFLSIGDPFFWLTSKLNASGSGAKAIINEKGFNARELESIGAILFIFPLAPLVILKWKRVVMLWKPNTNEKIILMSALLFMSVFFGASFFLFHGADPKYLLLVAFPCSILTIRLLELSSKRIKLLATIYIIALVPVYMVIFNFRSYNIELDRKMGRVILEELNLDKESKMWSDFPTVLLYSKWNPKKAVSTESILKDKSKNFNIRPSTLVENNIKYLIVSDSGQSRVIEFFPFLNSNNSTKGFFEKENIDFILLHKESPPKVRELTLKENIFEQLENYALSTNRTISIWEIRAKDP